MRLTIEGKPLFLTKLSQKVVPKPHFSCNVAILAGFVLLDIL